MIVMKFGGSSVRDADRISHVCEIIQGNIDRCPALVFSALGSTTDNLIEAGDQALQGTVDIKQIVKHHRETAKALRVDIKECNSLFSELEDLLKGISLLKELSDKTSDYLVSFGERLSVRMISAYLNSLGIKAKSFDGWDLGILTDSNHKNAELLPESYQNIRSALEDLKRNYEFTPVITGFIAKNEVGHITTLGRGGSDLTASLVGAALKVDEIQVWKDVDGILTTDPRIVDSARPVPVVSFEEASELAYFGAKVLHPVSIKPAMSENIPVRVKNSYNPAHPGSAIVGQRVEPTGLIKAITYKRNVTLIDIVSSRMLGQYGFLAKVFEIFKEHRVSVDMVATSEVSISITLNNGVKLDKIIPELERVAKVTVSRGKAILSLICDVRKSSEILDQVFGAFRAKNINVQMISQGASKVNIGLIVEEDEIEECLREIHGVFFPEVEAAA